MNYLGTTPALEMSRDAVHVPIVACQSEEQVFRGQDVYLAPTPTPGVIMVARAAAGTPAPIGIVDPFRHDRLDPGIRFWVCLFPGTAAAVTHLWTHPAFDLPPAIRFDEESSPGVDAAPVDTGRLRRSIMTRDHFDEPAPPPEPDTPTPREIHLSTGIAPATEPDDEDEDEDEDDEEPTHDRRDDDDGACGRCEY